MKGEGWMNSDLTLLMQKFNYIAGIESRQTPKPSQQPSPSRVLHEKG